MHKPRVCHITSVHPALDNRIFHKECISLARRGFEVHLIVANQATMAGLKEGVLIHNVELSKSRVPRMLFSTAPLLQKALEVDAQLYHFHDPELMTLGLKLKAKNKLVVYDSHEDVPRQLLDKPYIPRLLRPLVSRLYENYENKRVKQIDAVISPTPHIESRFKKIIPRSIAIANFPKLTHHRQVDWASKKNEVVYIGTLTEIRGIREIVTAMEHIDARLNLGGNWWEEYFKKSILKLACWHKVNFLGFLQRDKVDEVLSQSKVGIVTLHPTPSYQVAYSVKLFEYMAAGIPIVASDFPLWKSIIEPIKAGICVDPLQPKEIAKAVNYLLTHDDEAAAMGQRGRKAVESIYNWKSQEDKLVQLYLQLGLTPNDHLHHNQD